MQWLVFILLLTGAFLFWKAYNPTVYKPWRQIIKKRADKKLTQSQILTNKLSDKLMTWIEVDPIRKTQMDTDLQVLGYTVNSEKYMADALANALIASISVLAFIPFSVPLGIMLSITVIYFCYQSKMKKLKKESLQRIADIEIELAQFAGTISQSLKNTRDIVSILENYRVICGDTLREEIQRTLNDIKTGSTEKALTDLEKRVNSAKFSELIRGLISTYRGDNQQIYFDILASEFRKNQREIVKKQLLARQTQLKPYTMALLGCILLMLCSALGMYVSSQYSTIF